MWKLTYTRTRLRQHTVDGAPVFNPETLGVPFTDTAYASEREVALECLAHWNTETWHYRLQSIDRIDDNEVPDGAWVHLDRHGGGYLHGESMEVFCNPAP